MRIKMQTLRFSAFLTAVFAMYSQAIAADAPAAAPTTQPTKISIKVDAPNLQEAAQQLTQQLGVRVAWNNVVARPIKYEAVEQPFVSALAGFFQSAALSTGNGSDTLFLMDGAPLQVTPINEALTLVVCRTTVSASAQVGPRRGSQPNSYSYSVQLSLLADPALRIVSVAQNVGPDALEYDGTPWQNGESHFGSNGFGESGNANVSPAWPVNIGLNSAKPATKITRLAGHVRAWQVAEEASVDVDIADIANPRVVPGQGVSASVTIEENGRRGGGLTVTLTGPAAEMYLDSRWQGVLRGAVQALDAEQKPIALNSNGAEPNAANKSVKIRLFSQGGRGFNDGGRGNDNLIDRLETVRVRLPLKVRAIEIPFELKDLPLP